MVLADNPVAIAASEIFILFAFFYLLLDLPSTVRPMLGLDATVFILFSLTVSQSGVRSLG
jgi:hypothetical protein